MKINTPIAESGEIEVSRDSALGELMVLGALYHTRQYDKKTHRPLSKPTGKVWRCWKALATLRKVR